MNTADQNAVTDTNYHFSSQYNGKDDRVISIMGTMVGNYLTRHSNGTFSMTFSNGDARIIDESVFDTFFSTGNYVEL